MRLVQVAEEIGKSTLLLQVADRLSATGVLVLYISGEESERQIKLRGERLGVQAPNLLLLPETNLENIFRGGLTNYSSMVTSQKMVLLLYLIKYNIYGVYISGTLKVVAAQASSL